MTENACSGEPVMSPDPTTPPATDEEPKQEPPRPSKGRRLLRIAGRVADAALDIASPIP